MERGALKRRFFPEWQNRTVRVYAAESDEDAVGVSPTLRNFRCEIDFVLDNGHWVNVNTVIVYGCGGSPIPEY